MLGALDSQSLGPGSMPGQKFVSSFFLLPESPKTCLGSSTVMRQSELVLNPVHAAVCGFEALTQASLPVACISHAMPYPHP